MTGRATRSAGILLFRRYEAGFEVLIGHPGGPFWKNKQEGSWSIPKGLLDPGEDEQVAALREFAEETGRQLEPEALIELGSVQLRSGKTVVAWAAEGDLDAAAAVSNLVVIEWPRGSGRMIEFPEIDEVRWCSPQEARILLNTAQVEFVIRLQEWLDRAP